MDLRSIPRFVCALGFGLAGTAGCSIHLGLAPQPGPLQETVVAGDAGPKFALIELRGVITESAESSLFAPDRPSHVSLTLEALDRAAKDEVAGLLLSIHSPGGTATASDTLFHEIERWKAENEKPVLAFLDGLATSGGYYVAMGADHILAHPTTVTGSVGVVMVGVNVSGLMQKVGIADQTLTSGSFKDAGSPLRPMRPAERAQLQSVIDDLFARFRSVVVERRPELDPDALAELSDGRVYSAPQALEGNLIDAIGYFDDAIDWLESQAGVTESRIVTYHPRGDFRSNVYASAPVQTVQIDLLGTFLPRLAPGFYYIWRPLLAD
ncbi:MAG: signal peptide peptidase SppA [Myxococcota bacterium]|nr:signal peptide peptidase SppA [Myxococcota bacterium]